MAAARNVAETFLPALRYQPLDSSDRQIRLLKISPPTPTTDETNDGAPLRCELTTVSLNATPPPIYTALSYAWGDATHGLHELVIGDAYLRVTANLHQALASIRAHHGTQTALLAAGWLWIDAVCINQANVEERNEQVALMRDIYRDATRVLIWLGPGGCDSDDLIDKFITDTATEWHDGDSRPHQKTNKDTPADGPSKTRNIYHRNAVLRKRLLARPWFSRKWILQELVLARADPLVVCGSRDMSWGQLTRGIGATILDISTAPDALAQYDKVFSEVPWYPGASGEVIAGQYFLNLFDMTRDLRSIYMTSGGHLSMANLITYTDRRAATDSRDHVYGVLGMLRPSDADLITIDYATKSPAQVMREAFMIAWRTEAEEHEDFWAHLSLWDRPSLEAGKLDQKEQLGPCSPGTSDQLPSWAVDLDHGAHPKCDDHQAFARDFWAHTAYHMRYKGIRWRHRMPLHFSQSPGSRMNNDTLHLQSYRLDTIVHVESTDIPATFQVGSSAFVNTLRDIEHAVANGRDVPIPAQSHLISLAGLRDTQTCGQAFGSGEGLELPILLDEVATNALNSGLLWEIALGRAEVPESYRPDDPLRASDSERFRAEMLLPLDLLTWQTFRGRKVVRTEHGFAGVATPPVVIGDVVVLVPGMGCPYVLRPAEEEDAFRLVGFVKVAGLAGAAMFKKLDACVERSQMKLDTFRII